MLPFTAEQFFAVFAGYNRALWPAQIAAYALGLSAIAALLRPRPAGGRFIAVALAMMWLWTGFAYHWLYFSAINTAAFLFGALFIIEGGLLLQAALRGQLEFGFDRSLAAIAGIALVAYATALYPLIGFLTGHGWPALPMFGVTPCPTTLFTFGCLLLATTPVPRRLLVIPVLWSLTGGTAAFLLDVPQDWPLLFGGAATVALLLIRDRRHPT